MAMEDPGSFSTKKTMACLGGLYRIVVGTVPITAATGGALNVNTGLNILLAAVGCAKDTDQAAGDIAYVTFDFGSDGLLDIYCWDDAGALAASAGTVMIIAIGY
jgi:hypothetical protein